VDWPVFRQATRRRVHSILRRASRSGRSWAIGQFLGYLLLAVWCTWPLAVRIGDSLTLGTETAATVPLFTTWTVWWNADRASRFFENYWDAPIFHPALDTFAFSEPIATSVLVAPLVWISGNRLLAHNVFLLLALALNGWAGFHLLRRARVGRWCATTGGAMIVLLPMVQTELGVLQLVPVGGILGTMFCLLRFRQRPCAIRAVWLGTMFAATYLTCANYGLFLSVLLLVAAPWLLGRRWIEARTWRALPAAAAVGLLLVAPVVFAQIRVAQTHGLVRSPELVKRLSARAADYLVVPRPSILEPAISRRHRQQPHFPLCPGLIVCGLAVAGTCSGLARRRSRRWTVFCLTVLTVALLLSLGPGWRLAGWSPYGMLMDWYPGFAQVRSPFRLAIFVQLMTVLLAVTGLDHFERWVRRAVGQRVIRRDGRLAGPNSHEFGHGKEDPNSHEFGYGKEDPNSHEFGYGKEGILTGKEDPNSHEFGYRRKDTNSHEFGYGRGVRAGLVSATVVLAVAGLALLEILPQRQRLYAPPALATQQGWIEWLRANTTPECVIACLPLPEDGHVSRYEQTALWMYWSTFHQRRLINGYSGFLPEHYVVTKRLLAGFPDDASLDRLRSQGATHCVILREYRTRARPNVRGRIVLGRRRPAAGDGRYGVGRWSRPISTG
jgi:hypothetical protein